MNMFFVSKSAGVFGVDEAAGGRQHEASTNRRRERVMDENEHQDEPLAAAASAEAVVFGILLAEIVDALRAREIIRDEDIAAALLRTEYRAQMADNFGVENGNIFSYHASVAQIAIEDWQRRLTLEPMLYALRKVQHDWLAAGQKGRSPLHADRIVADYADDPDE